MVVDISDALSEKDKVKFTVHTKVSIHFVYIKYFCQICNTNWNCCSQTALPEFQKTDFTVVRQHEEFVWLHDRFEENEEYAGYIVSLIKLLL